MRHHAEISVCGVPIPCIVEIAYEVECPETRDSPGDPGYAYVETIWINGVKGDASMLSAEQSDAICTQVFAP